MSLFDKHLFFCTNQRENGESCCNDFKAQELHAYVKDKVKELGINNENNRIRINKAGCLGICDQGPVIVVYPEGTWYTYVDKSDLDEIIEQHLKNGNIVERLKIQ